MKFATVIIFLLRTMTVFAQENAVFDEGIIVTKQGDSIKCLVRVDAEYGSAIVYKIKPDGKETSIRKKEVKSILSSHEYLENIQVGKKELLMVLVVKGKALLFQNIATGAPRRQSLLGMSTQTVAVPIIVYVIKKGATYTEIKREHYREMLSGLMFDCPWLAQKMRSRDQAYTYEETDKAVATYNSCF